MGGIGCIFLSIIIYFINSTRIPQPNATTTGTVIRYISGTGSRTSKQSDSCTYAYKVEGKTYTVNSTCGGFFPDREGDKAEITYQTTNPANAAVIRSFLFLLIIGFPILIFGLLIMRMGMRMSADEEQSNEEIR